MTYWNNQLIEKIRFEGNARLKKKCVLLDVVHYDQKLCLKFKELKKYQEYKILFYFGVCQLMFRWKKNPLGMYSKIWGKCTLNGQEQHNFEKNEWNWSAHCQIHSIT